VLRDDQCGAAKDSAALQAPKTRGLPEGLHQITRVYLWQLTDDLHGAASRLINFPDLLQRDIPL
jgi:hypothetical protein